MIVLIGAANLLARLGAAKKKAEQARGAADPVQRQRTPVNIAVSRAEPADQGQPMVSAALSRGSEAMEQAARAIERRLDMMLREYEQNRSAGAEVRPSPPTPPPPARVKVVPAAVPVPSAPAGARTPVAASGMPGAASQARVAAPLARPAISPRSIGGSKVRKPWNAKRMREGLLAAIILAPPPSASR